MAGRQLDLFTPPAPGEPASSAGNPVRRILDARRALAGLSRADLIRRIGYRNAPKGLRRLDRFERTGAASAPFIAGIAAALAIDPALLGGAAAEQRDKVAALGRVPPAPFRPGGVILTERRVPQPIFIAHAIGPEKLIGITFPDTAAPVDYARIARAETLARPAKFNGTDGTIVCFGRITGFVVNYAPDDAVAFDLEGRPVERLAEARRIGRSTLRPR